MLKVSTKSILIFILFLEFLDASRVCSDQQALDDEEPSDIR